LKVVAVRNSRLVDISFSAASRDLSFQIANRVAEAYIAFNSEAEYNTTERATTSLAYQIANLQEGIDRKEQDLQKYAQENGIIALSEKQNITLKNLNEQNDGYVRSRAERIEREALYAALLESTPQDLQEVRKSQIIQELEAKLTDLQRREAQLSEKFKKEWPDMVRLQREIGETQEQLVSRRQGIYQQVLGEAESAFRAARKEEEYLKIDLEDQTKEFQKFSLKEIQYNNLKAEVGNRRKTLEALVIRQSETASSVGLKDLAVSNVRIVDPAEVPSKPSSPNIPMNILLSLVCGLVLGVGLAFFFEYLDKTVKSPEEVHQSTGVPCIGLVPSFRGNGARLRVVKGIEAENGKSPVELISHENPQSNISEAFREIRTALLLSRPGGPPRTILIGSGHPGEGKTMVALNLAITLSQIGRRVLLVDTDLRKPQLHKILQISNQRGLSNCLGGLGDIDIQPHRTRIPGLELVPSGPIPPNPADLLDSERLLQVQKQFGKGGYDHIIYDSPPILAVADPAILGGHVEGVVLVAHAGVTGREALHHAAKKLRQVNAPLLGAILNRVDLSMQAYYGYSYKGYYSEIEADPVAPVPETGVRAAVPEMAKLV
ncbi:MAG: polysaccharide biosynthesis tyrosine autokinase, partial [Acidobacteriota bacterium]